ncbi:MAG: carboxymuconolactone decarboxylase family protein [Planifilum sp.]|jgi:AhpD family alkylhydroperoxidase
MEPSMIHEALREYKEGIGHFEQELPEVAAEYNRFTEACFAEGELSRQVKHLIGLALGVYTNDEYCIIYHTKGAVDQGATDRQIMEAAAVSGAFGGGAAMSQAVTLVREAIQAFRNAAH